MVEEPRAAVRAGGTKRVMLCFYCKGENHREIDCPKKSKDAHRSGNFQVTTCFICSGKHRTDQFWKDETSRGGKVGFVRKRPIKSQRSRSVIPVFVNDVECEVYRDSGSAILIVRESLVAGLCRQLTEVIRVVDAFGRTKEFRTAIISVRSPIKRSR